VLPFLEAARAYSLARVQGVVIMNARQPPLFSDASSQVRGSPKHSKAPVETTWKFSATSNIKIRSQTQILNPVLAVFPTV
jgi:hypothetical protein